MFGVLMLGDVSEQMLRSDADSAALTLIGTFIDCLLSGCDKNLFRVTHCTSDCC